LPGWQTVNYYVLGILPMTPSVLRQLFLRVQFSTYLFIFLSFGTINLYAQTDSTNYPKHTIYAEYLGPGWLYSVNYEYGFSQNYKARIGLSQWKVSDIPLILSIENTIKVFTLPVMVNYISGTRYHHLEAGIGMVYVNMDVKGKVLFFDSEFKGLDSFFIGAATLGYRFQPPHTGPVFKIALVPLFDTDDFFLSGSIGLGFTF
jgi:hypothetical protein